MQKHLLPLPSPDCYFIKFLHRTILNSQTHVKVFELCQSILWPPHKSLHAQIQEITEWSIPTDWGYHRALSFPYRWVGN